MDKKPQTYLESGVNIELADSFVGRIKAMSASHHQSLSQNRNSNLLQGAGGYASVYQTGHGAVAATTDGVGSKLLLCEELGVYDTIGIDLVAMCANDLICVGARPAFFLDYFACGKLKLEEGTALIKGIIEGCQRADMLLVGGETAEMPDLYAKDHFDLAGFAVGFVEHGKLLTGDHVGEGDIVIGVGSSGIHSNGYSLARKLIAPGSKFRSELLTPTHIYVKPFIKVMNTIGGDLTGGANITGGGWTNLNRLNKNVGFELKAMPLSPIFAELAKNNIERAELYRTFNMGLGFALTVRGQDAANKTMEIFNSSEYGFSAEIIGQVNHLAKKIQIDDLILE